MSGNVWGAIRAVGAIIKIGCCWPIAGSRRCAQYDHQVGVRPIMTRVPIGLALTAAAVAAGAIFLPGRASVAARVPINLQAGEVTTAEFDAAWDYQYDIGIEMDGTVAERLFPCTADTTRFGKDCVGARLPVSLGIILLSDGVDVSDQVSRPTSTTGGSYSRDGSQETYVWPAAYVELSQDKHYTLNVQSLTDGSTAAPANPMLRIAVSSAAGDHGIFRGLIFIGSLPFLIVGVVWTLLSLVRRRTSP